MISQIHELTGFQRDLLVAIESIDGKPSGQEIKDRVNPLYESVITSGRLYPNLDKLEKRGMIERGEKDRRTNWYSLTDKGEETLANYREFVEE